ncbi:MAG: DUF1080 domain-containing protein [Candidatus Hydrogenedentes bacterium]|nr:DUF1080 domain-containing protein [Candidatus Hydrogenedentota bacterium]
MFTRVCGVVLVCLAIGCATAEKTETASTLEPGAPAQVDTKLLKQKAKVDFALTHNLNKDGTPNAETFVQEKDFRVSEFIGSGGVWTEGDVVHLVQGNDMTGIVWGGPLPSMNYEVSLDAKRTDGDDFFCGLTFPVGKDPCSLVVGGWGGRLVGISSLDWLDASENGTASWRDFAKDQWYSIRLRVTPGKIEAWIDGEQLVDVDTEGRGVGIRFEMEPTRPFGIATWRTSGAIRNMRIRAFEKANP